MNSDLRFTNRVQSGFLGNWGELDGQAAGNSARVADDPAAAANRLHASRTTPVDGGHLLLEPRAEGPHIRRFSTLLQANEAISAARLQGQVERRDQTPRAQIVVGERVVSEQHAGPFDRGVERVIRAIESKATTDVGVPHASGRKPVGPVRHRRATGEAVVMDERYPPEHVRRCEGPVFFDEARTADRHEGLIEQLFDLERVIMRRINWKIADRGVDTVSSEIGVVHRRGNAHVDFGISDRRAVEPRRQPFRGEAGRRADHEHARVARRLEARQCVPDMKKAGLQAGVERFAYRRQGDRPHAAVEEFDAQTIFQSANLVA
jgi:hypothetical protein